MALVFPSTLLSLTLLIYIFLLAGVSSTVTKKTTTATSTVTKSAVGATRTSTTASRPATARTSSASTTGTFFFFFKIESHDKKYTHLFEVIYKQKKKINT